ncbi:MerR family transcriptional regulator [Sedimentibacter sp. zth1]|uniref:MerR family transcriptional regulator n=1 Tax=Sedimentibacter sp. zth1 TaxID=2816908 RepID=UPI001A92DB53|nr:MerR family transcriptional regulator [Sedimentibacter sp. zth1]QSX06033.1 MerR family transcriptional regulator [Sedimentibacter sp. zth1]
MKNYYKINEISTLYNIGKDSLRYYEKIGILKPKREDNGYRLYSIQDIWRLNIIKDLRNLNFSMNKIKEYLENRTIENTLDILNQEIDLITKSINKLNYQKSSIKERMKSLQEDFKDPEKEIIDLKHFDERKVIMLNDNFSRDEEADFLIKKLHKKYENKLYLLGNNYVGVTMNATDVINKIYNSYTSVFFILNKNDKNYDFVLPEGDYVTLQYNGDYSRTKEFLPKMISFINENNMEVLSDPIELYKIDVHETSDVSQYLTQLQILVKKA